MTSRRALLRLLAAGPLLASGAAREALGKAMSSDELEPMDALVTRASDALDLFDLERVAKANLSPAHWGYVTTGVDGEETLRANRDAYGHWQLRTRRLVDLSRLDMSVELFGHRYASPIYLSAVGAQRAFHPDGELGSARAAKSHNQLQMLSTSTSYAIEEVIKARGEPVWYQLYATSSFDITMKLVQRAEAAGCTALAVTVDEPVGWNSLTNIRWRRVDKRDCTACHAPDRPNSDTLPMYQGLDMRGVSETTPQLTWDFVRRIKDRTRMKVLVKGLESGDDAALAVRHGLDGVVVSNHGGRATETGRGTLDSLPEVVKAAGGKIPVFVDGGVRRGVDALKALALGATAVGIGRPYAWGLSAFGEAGVDRALAILNEELRLSMAGVGARSVQELTPGVLIRKV